MPEQRGTFTSFAATHEDRLVRSVVSETGLSPAAAARVAADVLPWAYDRRFGTPGAAYGWLRVAARHHAAGDPAWAVAADAALGRAGSARSVLAALPAADRELLRLRYVEGLRPAAVADRLGVPLADVLARLDGASAAAADALTRSRPVPAAPAGERRVLDFPLVRVAAAAAAVAAAVLVAGQGTPRQAPPLASAPGPSFADPGTGDAVIVPVASSDLPDRRVVSGAVSRDGAARVSPPARDPGPPSGTCRTGCGGGGGGLVDEVHISVPKDARDTVGRDEIVVRQEHGSEHVHVCDALQPLPREHAYCVRGRG